MNLQILIPNLFWPDSSQPEIYGDLSLSGLEKMLSKSEKKTYPSETLETWLCKSFHIDKQKCDWPIAPIMVQNDSMNSILPNSDFWMRADPVHLRIEQNHIMLADSQAFKISKEESQQIAQIINCCLDNKNILILPLQSDRWYLRCTEVPELETFPLSDVTCRNINDYLPIGNQSVVWRKIFNEIQMVLHDHPINQVRESRGELAINSVWFWGGGVMPQVKIESIFSHVWGNHEFLRALAFYSNAVWKGVPINGEDFLQNITIGDHLIVLDSLYGRAQYRDAYGWRESLKKMEIDWFTPLCRALEAKKISQLTLTALGSGATQSFCVTANDLWKFWRKMKSMAFLSESVLPVPKAIEMATERRFK
ncbi:MAG: phosphoglycerate mutase [Pseudomonadota bacterium]